MLPLGQLDPYLGQRLTIVVVLVCFLNELGLIDSTLLSNVV